MFCFYTPWKRQNIREITAKNFALFIIIRNNFGTFLKTDC